MEECFDLNEPEEQPRGARICDILAAAMEKARAATWLQDETFADLTMF